MRRHLLATMIWAGLGFAAALCAAPAAAQTCTPKTLVVLDMGFTPDGGITFPAKFGELPVTLLLKAGDDDVRIRKEVGIQAGLRAIPATHPPVFESGYYEYYQGAHLQIGPWNRLGSVELVDDPWGLGRLPSDIAGTFGMHRMSDAGLDVDLDFVQDKITLTINCEGWNSEGGAAAASIALDGQPVAAVFDTTRATSELSLETATKLFSPHSYQLKPVPGGKGLLRYPFRSISFGGAVLDDPPVFLRADEAAGRGFHGVPLTIGTDILRRFHIVFARGRIDFVRNATDAH
jgi:hypothetical protein